MEKYYKHLHKYMTLPDIKHFVLKLFHISVYNLFKFSIVFLINKIINLDQGCVINKNPRPENPAITGYIPSNSILKSFF